MAEIKFHKVTTLPGSLEANSIYFVLNGDYAECYITNSSGVAKSMGNSSMINALLAAAMTSVNSAVVVADITARNALAPTIVKVAYVKNATGDATVSSGGATYVYDPSDTSWTKIAEFESMDAAISWSNISGKPTSTPGDIDDAVSKRHTHANKTVLDGITATGNVLEYNGAEVKSWNTLNW